MNAPSEDVKDILATYDSSSVIYNFGTTLFVAHEPSSPDRCITILDTGGFSPDVVATYERPTIQIRSRDLPNQFIRAYNTIKGVVDLLHGNRFTINSTIYTFFQQGDILDLGRDENNRVLLTANMLMHRTSS